MLGIKKADIILCLVIIAAGIILTLIIGFAGSSGTKVVITAGGSLYGIYDLDEDREITIKQGSHINKVTIKDSTVSMVFSDCPNQICVSHKSISKTNESITCLPNKVMVTIEGDREGGYDAVSG